MKNVQWKTTAKHDVLTDKQRIQPVKSVYFNQTTSTPAAMESK